MMFVDSIVTDTSAVFATKRLRQNRTISILKILNFWECSFADGQANSAAQMRIAKNLATIKKKHKWKSTFFFLMLQSHPVYICNVHIIIPTYAFVHAMKRIAWYLFSKSITKFFSRVHRLWGATIPSHLNVRIRVFSPLHVMQWEANAVFFSFYFY